MSHQPNQGSGTTTHPNSDAALDAIGRENFAILVHDLETGSILAANRSAEELYGHTSERLRSMRIKDLLVSAKPDIPKLLRESGSEIRQKVELEWKSSCPRTWVATSWVGPTEWNGIACAFTITPNDDRSGDVTESASGGSGVLDFLEGTQMGTWEWHVQTGKTHFNNRWAEICGYTLDELQPTSITTWNELVHPEDQKRSNGLLQRHFDGKLEHYDMECRMRHKEGHWVWVRDTGKVVSWTPDGLPALMLGTHLDITDQKLIEAELRRSLSILDQSEKLANFGGWHLDLERDELTWTDGVCRVFGIEAGKEPPTYAAFLSVVHPDDRGAVDEAYSNSVSRRSPGYEIEHRIIRRDDGRIRHVVERCKHDFNDAGEVVRSIGTVQDITERKDREASRLRFEQEAQHAQKLESLGVMAGGIAHDFNNILAGILGHTEIATLELPAEHTALASLRVVTDAVRNARDLTKKMLSYAGQGVIEKEITDLSEMVEAMSNLLRAAVPRNLVLETDFRPGVPPILVDRGQLQQVILNLITNAAEAIGTVPGTVKVRTGMKNLARIRAEASPDAFELNTNALPPGDCVYLEVSDTGAGMPREVCDRIFEPFYSTKRPGRGLGMSAVMGIINHHHGAIHFESTVGKGTKFYILIPPCDADEPLSKQNEREKLRILIADDEQSVLKAFIIGLRHFGFEVEGVQNGREALEVFSAPGVSFDCVVLDMTMPLMGGKECMAKLQEGHPDIPIVLTSGNHQESPCGMDSVVFLDKPFTISELRDGILEAISRDLGVDDESPKPAPRTM